MRKLIDVNIRIRDLVIVSISFYLENILMLGSYLCLEIRIEFGFCFIGFIIEVISVFCLENRDSDMWSVLLFIWEV